MLKLSSLTKYYISRKRIALKLIGIVAVLPAIVRTSNTFKYEKKIPSSGRIVWQRGRAITRNWERLKIIKIGCVTFEAEFLFLVGVQQDDDQDDEEDQKSDNDPDDRRHWDRICYNELTAF